MKSTIKQTHIIFFKACVILVASCFFQPAFCQRATITIVNQSKSVYSIIVPEQAPESLKIASLELQRDIQEATGVLLPLITTGTSHVGKFISLGATPQAKAAGINIKQIGLEGFWILTKERNIYIAVQTHAGRTVHFNRRQKQWNS
jgi:hypothetical protein